MGVGEEEKEKEERYGNGEIYCLIIGIRVRAMRMPNKYKKTNGKRMLLCSCALKNALGGSHIEDGLFKKDRKGSRGMLRGSSLSPNRDCSNPF